jgi:putative ABC transport system permease protein
MSRSLADAGFSRGDGERILAATQDAPGISAVLVKLSPGVDREQVRTAIARGVFLNVYTSAEQRHLMLAGRLMKSTVTLGMFRSLLLIVSVVIMSLIVYILTMDKIKAIATLKLIGAPNRVIVRLILEQALTLALLGFVLAYGLVQLTPRIFPRSLVFEPMDTLVTFTVVMLGGMVASLFGIWRALRTSPSVALAG